MDSSCKIPVKNIIERLDEYLAREDLVNARSILTYWIQAAIKLGDVKGQVSVENEMIGLVRRNNDKMAGLASIDRVLSIIDKGDISDQVAVATTRLNCATTYEHFGYIDEAMPLYETALEQYEKLLAPDDPRQAGIRNNMSYALAQKGDFLRAAEFAEEAARIMLMCGNKCDAAVSYVNLAELYNEMFRTGKPGASEEAGENTRRYLYEAYKLLESVETKDGYLAYTLRKCAPAFTKFGFDVIGDELEALADQIYEGNRTPK